jgi:hypothetical protein
MNTDYFINRSKGEVSGPESASQVPGKPANEPAVNRELNDKEIAGLLHMREIEKLAHDVYATFYYDYWGRTIFLSIANSERSHTNAINVLIEQYGLDDPASEQEGVFSNPSLLQLYTNLVTLGSQSVAEALKVGASIEEIDILDLKKYLSETDQADIQQVYQNLLRGSNGHLRAFVSTLNALTGEVYQPQYLSKLTYQAILGSKNGKGM